MECTSSGKVVRDVVRECFEEAVRRRSIPKSVAEYAAHATIRKFEALSGPEMERRARAYFAAVVRRRIVRTHGNDLAAARLVAESVVTDLVNSGRSRAEAWEELRRGWMGTLPDELIDEYRTSLCA